MINYGKAKIGANKSAYRQNSLRSTADLSDPVAQATMRIVKVFWGLDSSLAYRRHFPAINWLNSYSLYYDRISVQNSENIAKYWREQSTLALKLLQIENELEEIVKLVGIDALSPSDRIVLETTRSIREDYLQQDAFRQEDAYTPLKKQARILKIIILYYNKCMDALKTGADFNKLIALPVKDDIARAKEITADKDMDRLFDEMELKLTEQINSAIKGEGV